MNNNKKQGQVLVKNLTVVYKGKMPIVAVKNFSFEVNPGEFVSIVGPSGCGKSTTLNVIAGFVKPSSGEVFLDGKRITSPGSDRGVVFQNYALFPWKSVFHNIEFGPKMNRMKKDARRKLVEEYIQQIRLRGFEKKYPFELSSGMAQRVALARVLVNNPVVLLLDEPFGSLDAQTRIQMEELLLKIWDSNRRTVIFVTHDIEEAIFLSDRVIVMTASPGRLKTEVKVPLERPRTYEIIGTPEFSKLKLEIHFLIKEEILNASPKCQ